MIFSLCKSKKTTGFTLVELMVAITISSIIMLGVVSLYSSARKGDKSNEALARIQENMRFAADMISKDIRMAGYRGCRGFSITNALDDTSSFQYQMLNPLIGYEAASVPAAFPAVGINPGDRIANTDAIVIMRASATGYKVTNHNPYIARISLDATAAGIKINDLISISDCNHTAIFQVSGPATPATYIEHAKFTGTPGNCWQNFGVYDQNNRPACTASNSNYSYSINARVHKYIMHGYFIGRSTSGLTNSLYIFNLNEGTNSAFELIEGVENLQISYGVVLDPEDANETTPVRYIRADQFSGSITFLNVVAVRFGMLLTSINDIKKTNGITKTYNLAGTDISVAGDRKLRFSYNTSVKIRNVGGR